MTLDENTVVAWFEDRLGASPEDVPIGIGDDMAEIALHGAASLFFATDTLVEHTHFDLTTASLEQVGYKAMAVNLSDCAAMATLPVAAVVAVTLPRGFTESGLEDLYAGIRRASRHYRCPVVGGDTTSTGSASPLIVCVSMLSRCQGNVAITRAGARPGDCVCVTGTLGGSLTGKHLCFEPRLAEAMSLAKAGGVSAMMDISDGLSTDLARLCQRSGVGAMIEATQIPLSDQARTREDPLRSALHEGEDFELLFTLAPEAYAGVRADWPHATPITRIGRITETSGIRIRTSDDRISALLPEGFDHFKWAGPSSNGGARQHP